MYKGQGHSKQDRKSGCEVDIMSEHGCTEVKVTTNRIVKGTVRWISCQRVGELTGQGHNRTVIVTMRWI